MIQATEELQRPFVGIHQQTIDLAVLKGLVERCITGNSWHCLRWPHKIEFDAGLPADFSCLEGQVFDQDRELRWKQRGSLYEVLLLSNTAVTDVVLQPLDAAQTWITRDRNANFYPPTETRFPREVTYPKNLNIGQRYFIDDKTGIVQFVALRAVKHGK